MMFVFPLLLDWFEFVVGAAEDASLYLEPLDTVLTSIEVPGVLSLTSAEFVAIILDDDVVVESLHDDNGVDEDFSPVDEFEDDVDVEDQ